MAISIHNGAAVDELGRRRRMDPHLLKRLRNAFYKQARTPAEALAVLPPTVRADLERALRFEFLSLVHRRDSKADGATKLALRTEPVEMVEAVILRVKSGRTTLCVSTQTGCAAGCVFCATARQTVVRNLTADEILDQLVQANRVLQPEGRRVRNLVVMGMGEPLHNEAHLHAALEVVRSARCFGLSERHIAVSTVGVPDAMVRFARRFPAIRLAVSLHSARQDRREALMPIARAYPLDRLRKALREVAGIQHAPVMIEYLLFKGVNDAAADIGALADYLRDIPARINLIPFNAVDHATGLVGASNEERQAFARCLRAAGFTVNLRYSLGADIAAACGQLADRLRSRSRT